MVGVTDIEVGLYQQLRYGGGGDGSGTLDHLHLRDVFAIERVHGAGDGDGVNAASLSESTNNGSGDADHIHTIK